MRYAALLLLLLASPGWAGSPLRVAVAANFRHTLEQISTEFSGRVSRWS
jgi:hypothetical protein